MYDPWLGWVRMYSRLGTVSDTAGGRADTALKLREGDLQGWVVWKGVPGALSAAAALLSGLMC
jgi:hypothetical protein